MIEQERPPCLLHEDDDLVALSKPAGVNTHRSGEHAQDGFYEWARSRSPGWGDLALLHRLDKETSGAILFAKSARGAKSLQEQMESRSVEKRYVFFCAAARRPRELSCDDRVAKPRRGVARLDPAGASASTDFTVLERRGAFDLVLAQPRAGRTHQIRLHAQRLGMPILGDRLYGGPQAARLFLHAKSIDVRRPSGEPLHVEAPLPPSWELVSRERPTSLALAARVALEERLALLDPERTDCFRWLDGAEDGVEPVRVERLGSTALVLRHEEVPARFLSELAEALEAAGARAVVERVRPKDPRGEKGALRVLSGMLEKPRFLVREEGLSYWVDLEESATSTGLFLDEREARRRLARMNLAGKTVLNAFAHAGAFSVAAARAGATTLSLDLSKKYLEWTRENLRANGLDPGAHDFIYGDALEWLARLAKKGRRFDLVILDPPSFSTAKRGKTWSAERDLGDLVARGLRCLAPSGTLFCATSQRGLSCPRFLEHVRAGFALAKREIVSLEYATLPLDFRTGAGAPPHLKSVWAEAGP